MNATPAGLGEPVPEPLEPADPRRLGRYDLLGRLGQGGMGTVYLGRSDDGRPVAVKVIRSEYAREPDFRRLFQREAETARRVARFCTAEVLDVSTDAARPYIVTEYVPGPTLERVIREHGPMRSGDLERLAVSVAAALTAIHGAGLVHRDLKPSNVLLSPLGPRVIDFGIARALDATTMLSRTRAGSGPGTPAFMSPEQATGADVGPAADVFAWGGVVAYAAAGRQPFGEGNPTALLYRVVHEQPDLSGLTGTLRDVVEAAMAKDPAARPGAGELFPRLLGANPAAFSRYDATRVAQAPTPPAPPPTPPAVAAAGTARLERAPDERTARLSPPRQGPPPSDPWRQPDSRPRPDTRPLPPTRLDDEKPTPVAGSGEVGTGPGGAAAGTEGTRSRRPGWLLPVAAAAAFVLVAGGVGVGIALGGGKKKPDVNRAAVSARVAAAARAVTATDNQLARKLSLLAYRVSPTPQARWALVAAYGVTSLATVSGHTDTVWAGSFSPDGRVLATASNDKTTRLWDVSNPAHPTQLASLTHPNAVYWATISPGGNVLADGGRDELGRLWDISDPSQPTLLSLLNRKAGSIYGLSFSPDGRTLAAADSDDTVELWDVVDPAHPAHLASLTDHTDNVENVAFSPDGRLLAAASKDRTVTLYDVSTPGSPSLLATLRGHTDTVFAAAFSPDGKTLATASADTTVRLWDVTTPSAPTLLRTLSGHTKVVTDVAFSPDGRTLVSTSDDQTARLWDVSNVRAPSLLTVARQLAGWVDSVAFSADGNAFVATGDPRTADIRDVDPARIAARACADPQDAVDSATWRHYVPELAYTPTCG